MSQENAELVRRVFDHIERTGEPLWEALDPEIEWEIDPTGLLAGTYRGHDGVRTFVERLSEGLDQARFEIHDLIDAGDSVVTLGQICSRGTASGVAAAQPAGVRVPGACGPDRDGPCLLPTGGGPRSRGAAGVAKHPNLPTVRQQTVTRQLQSGHQPFTVRRPLGDSRRPRQPRPS